MYFVPPRTLPSFSKSLTPSDLLRLQSSRTFDPSPLSYISSTCFAFPSSRLHEQRSSRHTRRITHRLASLSTSIAAFPVLGNRSTHLNRYVVPFLLLAVMSANIIKHINLGIWAYRLNIHNAPHLCPGSLYFAEVFKRAHLLSQQLSKSY